VLDLWRQATQQYDAATIVGAIVAGVLFLGLWTWKRQVDGLYIRLTGRLWVASITLLLWMPGYILFALLFFPVAWPSGYLDANATVLTVLPWLLTPLLLVRLLFGAWALHTCVQCGLLAQQTAAVAAVLWVLFAMLLFTLLAWLVPAELVPRYYLLCAVLLVLPTVRLAFSPLALAWNRHR
jgi:hypothetical protein